MQQLNLKRGMEDTKTEDFIEAVIGEMEVGIEVDNCKRSP